MDMDGRVVDRSKAANEHRLTSIREREKQKEAQKQLIKNALQELGSSSNPNHVTFSDSDEDDPQEKAVCNDGTQADADKLLGFDGDDNLNITLEQRFKSKNTGKLLELQSRYGNDSRFRLDDKFAESSDSSEENETVTEDAVITSEAKRNMLLIDQITGHTIRSEKFRSAETFSAKSSQRYDPSNNSNMEINMSKSKMRSPAKKKKPPVAEIDTPSNHDRFYDVSTDVLKNTFTSSRDLDSNSQQANTPFSFIEMLKLDPDVEDNKNTSPNVENNNSYAHEDISEDSSSSDEEIPMIVAPPDNSGKTAKLFPNPTFFPVSASGPLILGAAKNFCWNKTYDQMQKEWLEVKDILIKDYKKKHRDAKKKKADD